MTWGFVALGGAGLAGSIISGNMQADAAENAANTQSQAALQAAQMQADATEQQRQDLQPFAQQGLAGIPLQQQAMQQQQALFGPGAGQTVMNNPMFQALQGQAQTDIMQNAAVRGRLGTGGTQTHLQDAALRTGFDILNQERNAALANTQSVQNQIITGQNAAAGQATALGQGTQIQGNLITGAAAAQAAGQVGAANANTAMIGNMLGSITPSLTNLNFGTPTAAPVSAPVGGGNVQTTGYQQ